MLITEKLYKNLWSLETLSHKIFIPQKILKRKSNIFPRQSDDVAIIVNLIYMCFKIRCMEKINLAIVGGGVAGLSLGTMLHDLDIDFTIFEKNTSLPKGNRVISKVAFKKFKKIGVSEDVILNEIDEINFVSPSGVKISTSGKQRGYVIRYEKLLSELLQNFDNDLLQLKMPVIEVKNNVLLFKGGGEYNLKNL